MTNPNPYELRLAGERIDRRYLVERLIGNGGMGTVWLARDERVDGRPVVVKVPRASFLEQEGFLDRFEREIKSLTRLDHPRIVKVLDIAHVNDIPCVVLQFLGGGSLAERMTSAVKPEEIVPWITPIAEALDFIHSQGVIHRDVKPGNILFDGYGNAFLADFGIAKALGGEETGLTQSGASPGSPSFMAPEAGSPDALGPRYDQYSLAVVLYKALSNRLPHEGRTALEVIMKRSAEPPRPLREVAPHVPPPVERVVMKALSRQPGERYSSCRAFAADYVAAVGTTLSVDVPASEFTDAETALLRRGARAGKGRAKSRSAALAVAGIVVAGAAIFGWSRFHQDPHPDAGPPSDPKAEAATGGGGELPRTPKFSFDEPKEGVATDAGEIEVAGVATPSAARELVIGFDPGTTATVLIGANGAIRTRLEAPKDDGKVALVAWTVDRHELARREIEIDRTPPTVAGHAKESRPFDAGERSFKAEFDASEPVTLFDESGKIELGRLAAGKGEATLPLPGGATAKVEKRKVSLVARDRCAHEAKLALEVELYDVGLRLADLVARRPRPPEGFDALRGAELAAACTQLESDAQRWEGEVGADALLGKRREELTLAAEWKSLRERVRSAKEAASKVTVRIESPADGSAVGTAEVALRIRVDPPGAKVAIGVARGVAKEFTAGADGVVAASVPLPDKEGPCRIEVKGVGAATPATAPLLAQLDLVVDRSIAVNHDPVFEPDVTREPLDRDRVDHVMAKLDFGEPVTVTPLDPATNEPAAGAKGTALATGNGELPLPLPAVSGADHVKAALAFRVEDALKNRRDFRCEVELFSGRLANAVVGAANLQKIADWADVVRADADPEQVPDAKVRARIAATAFPWLVRHRQTGIEMLLVPPGEYLMGSMASPLERPVHRVKLTRPFYVGRYEVTQAEWLKVVASNPSKFQGDPRLPVEQVSYDDLTKSGGFLASTGLRLPTEGEWEYVAHGLNETRFPWGEQDDPECAHCGGDGGQGPQATAPVGSCPKGITWCGAFDVAGNVWEWCSDWYDAKSYESRVQPVVDPAGPASAAMRVIRGGAWNYPRLDARCANRGKLAPGDRFSYVGFRVAKTP